MTKRTRRKFDAGLKAKGEDRLGGVAGAGDNCRFGATLRDPSEPDLRLGEAASGAGGAGSRRRDRAAAWRTPRERRAGAGEHLRRPT